MSYKYYVQTTDYNVANEIRSVMVDTNFPSNTPEEAREVLKEKLKNANRYQLNQSFEIVVRQN